MDDDHWSRVAADWARLWGGFADPAREALIAAAGTMKASPATSHPRHPARAPPM